VGVLVGVNKPAKSGILLEAKGKKKKTGRKKITFQVDPTDVTHLETGSGSTPLRQLVTPTASMWHKAATGRLVTLPTHQVGLQSWTQVKVDDVPAGWQQHTSTPPGSTFGSAQQGKQVLKSPLPEMLLLLRALVPELASVLAAGDSTRVTTAISRNGKGGRSPTPVINRAEWRYCFVLFCFVFTPK
jgi:hypothetical protein